MMNQLRIFGSLVRDSISNSMQGSRSYHIWMGVLTFLMLLGAYCYYQQLSQGLVVTGMHDNVSWGLYISNFTFLVGVAAAAVMLVMPTYVLKDVDFSKAVLIGEGLAVAALIMCLAFVTVDLGGPGRAWHLIPGIGLFNFPQSMLAWDVIVLNGYLFINITIPLYILMSRYQNREPNKKFYIPGAMISVFWAVGIHMVTAFLYAGLPARPFWNSSLLGPRFLASAFAAGPALIIIILEVINRYTDYKIADKSFGKLAMVVTIAAQVNLIMLISELFKEFYAQTHHSLSAVYLFFGLHGKTGLVPWTYASLILNVVATGILTMHLILKSYRWLTVACVCLFVGIWIEKGMGLIIPGFIPGSWGDIVEYVPSWIEIGVTIGIWAMGAFIFTILAKSAISIEMGRMRYVERKVATTD
ncbi:sulfate reduction electron transfer complex DsrMKJOP subunit DsrP [Ekhidna sp.]|uniref:sulfate reduction electron transfer complex DsrMKJOP subunit DsrP n=1 Tax=Ekhidna sp. TaxID=2608089 RepID=UPI003B5012B9